MNYIYTFLLFFFVLLQPVKSQDKVACAPPYYVTINNLQFDRASFIWENKGSSIQYEFNYRQAGTSAWIRRSGLTTPDYSLTGLANNTSYECRVRTICAPGDSSLFSGVQEFRTQCYIPLFLSTSSISSNGAQLAWLSLSPYPSELQWRDAGKSAWNTIRGIVNTGYLLTGLSNNTTYEWRVRTVCSESEGSDFSPTQSFRTQCFTPYNPYASEVTHESARLNWNYSAVSDSGFEIQWRRLGTASWLSIENIPRSPFSLTNLDNDTAYEWRVRLVCTGSDQSDFTPIQVIQTKCDSPVVSGYTLIKATSATLRWVLPASAYRTDLEWKPASASTWNRVPVSENEYTLTDLKTGETYDWRLRTFCTPTIISGYVNGQAFTTACNLTSGTNFIQAERVSATRLQVTWSNEEPGVSFDMNWRPAGSATWNQIPGLTQTTYSLTGLTPDTNYEYQIRKVCSLTHQSAFYTKLVKTACYPPYSPSVNQELHSSVSVYWQMSDFFDGTFEVQWRPVGTTTWSSAKDIIDTAYTITGLTSGTTYEWQVRTVCGGNSVSGFAKGTTFSTRCGNATFPYAIQVSPTAAKVTWLSEPDIPFYDLQWRPVGSDTWEISTRISGTTFFLENLTPSVLYECRVRSRCSPDVAGEYSTVHLFSVGCPGLNPLVQGININSALITWPEQSAGAQYTLSWRKQGTTGWNIISGIKTPYCSLSQLAPNTSYEVQLAYPCRGGDPVYGNIVSFQTRCPIPVNLDYYDYGADFISLSWEMDLPADVRLAVRWRAENSTDWTYSEKFSGLRYTIRNLKNNTFYYWQLLVYCGEGASSNPYDGFSRSTTCPRPSTPYISQRTSSSVRLNWLPTSNDYDAFDVQWKPETSTVWTTIPGLKSTSYILGDLSADTLYMWRVRAVCPAKSDSDYTYPDYFIIKCFPLTVLHVENSNDIQANSAKVSWSGDSPGSGTTFTVRWRQAGTLIWQQQTELSGGSYTITDLLAGTQYEIQLQSTCNEGQVSGFGNSLYITTKTGLTAALSTRNITSVSALLTWQDITGPVQIQWRAATDVNWQTIDNVSGTSYQLTSLQNNTEYRWRINSYTTPVITPAVTFYTGCPAPYPIRNLQTGSDYFSFTLTGTDTLPVNIEWRVAGTDGWTNQTILTAPYRLTGLITNTVYEYRLQTACGGNNYSVKTPSSTFQTICPAIDDSPRLPVFPGFIPPVMARPGYTSAQLDWRPNTIGHYVVQWRPAGTFDWQTVSGITSNTFTITGLSPDTPYEYRIGTVCSADAVSPMKTSWFLTQCPKPIDLRVITASANAALVTWTQDPQTPRTILRYRPAGADTWTTIYLNNQSRYTIGGLTAGKTYQWEAGVDCREGVQSLFSQGPPFQTECTRVFDLSSYAESIHPIPDPSEPTRVTFVFSDTYRAEAKFFRIRYRPAGTENWQYTDIVNTWPFVISGLDGNTNYEWQFQTVCETDNSVFFDFRYFSTYPDTTLPMYTIMPGNWNQPNIWSGNRLPTAAETVRLRHAVGVPGTITGRSAKIRFEQGGKLRYKSGGRIRSGQ